MLCVPLGEPARVLVGARSAVDDAPNATGEVTFRRRDTRQQLGPTRAVEIQDGRGELAWIADGLEDDELACIVDFLVFIADEPVCQGAFRVFRRELTVVAKDGEGSPIEGARCRMVLTPHGDAALQYDMPDPRTLEIESNADGEVVFPLVPGEIALEWLSPYEEVQWPVDRGPEREVVLRRVEFVARFSGPMEGEHVAWVNEVPDPEDPLLGPVLRLEISGVEPDDDGVAKGAGADVYVRVKRDAGSERLDAEGPRVGTRPLTAGAHALSRVRLDDHSRAEFELHLGHGGGDTFTISIGSTPQCQDAEMNVTTWRRLYVTLYFAYEPDGAEVDAMQQHVVEAFEPSNIEVCFEDHVVDALDDTVVVVSRDHLTRMGLSTGPLENFSVYMKDYDEQAPNKRVDKLELELPEPVQDGRARINVVVVNGNLLRHNRKVELKWRGRSSGWRPFPVAKHEGFWVPFFFDDDPDAPASTSLAPAARDHGRMEAYISGFYEPQRLTAEDVEIDTAKKKFRITCALDRVETRTRVEATLHFYWLDPLGGSSTGSRIALTWGSTATPASVGHALVHEIGHSLHQAAVGLRNFPGVVTAHPNTYKGKQHRGPHCSTGLSAKDKASDDYQKLTMKGRHAACVMWGGVSPRFDYDKAKHFCPHCTRFLEAAKVSL